MIDAPMPTILTFAEKFEREYEHKSDHNGLKGYTGIYAVKAASERVDRFDRNRRGVLVTLRAVADGGVSVLMVEQNVKRGLAVSDHALALDGGRVAREAASSRSIQTGRGPPPAYRRGGLGGDPFERRGRRVTRSSPSAAAIARPTKVV
jgi:hypothetical protein